MITSIDQRKAEQAAIEATPEYRVEHALVNLEQAQQELQAARREASAVKRSGAKAYERKPFSLMR